MSKKFKIGFEEIVTKRHESIVEVPDDVTEVQMDKLCDKIVREQEFASHLIEFLTFSKGYKVSKTHEGAENGEIDIDELEEV